MSATMLGLGGSIFLATGAAYAAPTGFPDFDAECVALDTSVPSGVEVGSARHNGIDDRLNTYVGGVFTVGARASEVEGLTVVANDMVVNKPGWFGVGVVGAGSLISPSVGSDVLLVGGNLSGENSIDIADGYARVGGTATNMFPSWITNYDAGLGASALVTNNYSPAYDFNGFLPTLDAYSQNLAVAGAAGIVTVAGSTITLDGNGQTGQLRFDVPATALAGALTFNLVNLASTQPLVINVTGTGSTTSLNFAAVTVNAHYNDVPADHVADLGTSPTTSHATYPWNLAEWAFAGYATRIMWNFNDTAEIELTTGDQWIGSILAPSANLTASQSINGRVYVGGDLLFDGVGNEIHAFAWAGCAAAADAAMGTFNIAKAVTGPQATTVPDDMAFTVDYTVNGVLASPSLEILANGTVVNGPTLTVGDVVVFTEATPPDVNGVQWATPSITVDGTTTDTLTIAAAPAEVVVTNTANAVGAEPKTYAIGDFAWVDLNGNGAQGPGEPVLPGVTVRLLNSDGAAYQSAGADVTTTTNSEGRYVFDALPAGDYLVEFELTSTQAALYKFTSTLELEAGVQDDSDAAVQADAAVGRSEVITLGDANTQLVTSGYTHFSIVASEGIDPTWDAGVVYRTGLVSLAKTVVGPDATGASFDFSWTANAPEGVILDPALQTGTITATGDGTPVVLAAQFPVGTTVTFAETSVVNFDGWAAPTVDFAPASGTSAAVSEDTTAAVTATNTYESQPSVPEDDATDSGDSPQEGTDSPQEGTDSTDEGTDSPQEGTDSTDEGTDSPDEGTDSPDEGTDSPDEGTLSSTGAEAVWPMTAAALLMMCVGIALVMVRRRRH